MAVYRVIIITCRIHRTENGSKQITYSVEI